MQRTRRSRTQLFWGKCSLMQVQLLKKMTELDTYLNLMDNLGSFTSSGQHFQFQYLEFGIGNKEDCMPYAFNWALKELKHLVLTKLEISSKHL